jgi:hypothetical protein
MNGVSSGATPRHQQEPVYPAVYTYRNQHDHGKDTGKSAGAHRERDLSSVSEGRRTERISVQTN